MYVYDIFIDLFLSIGGGCKLCGSVKHFQKDCPENKNAGKIFGLRCRRIGLGFLCCLLHLVIQVFEALLILKQFHFLLLSHITVGTRYGSAKYKLLFSGGEKSDQ